MVVIWDKKVDRQLQKVPKHIAEKFRAWVVVVEVTGIHEARKLSGFHDEPLRGPRAGQRSIRLSRGYRAFYKEFKGKLELIEVVEVNKHDY